MLSLASHGGRVAFPCGGCNRGQRGLALCRNLQIGKDREMIGTDVTQGR